MSEEKAFYSVPEVRVTDPKTGGAKGSKPAQLGSIDPLALLKLAEVGGKGAEKYDTFNYLRGYNWSLSFNAMMRHALAFWAGEVYDPETGCNHAAMAAWHGLALTSFSERGLGTDDRYHQPSPVFPDLSDEAEEKLREMLRHHEVKYPLITSEVVYDAGDKITPIAGGVETPLRVTGTEEPKAFPCYCWSGNYDAIPHEPHLKGYDPFVAERDEKGGLLMSYYSVQPDPDNPERTINVWGQVIR